MKYPDPFLDEASMRLPDKSLEEKWSTAVLTAFAEHFDAEVIGGEINLITGDTTIVIKAESKLKPILDPDNK